ncbi:MAG: hypothetical protein ACRENP_15810, partial [Longimicrobiales bacterium]
MSKKAPSVAVIGGSASSVESNVAPTMDQIADAPSLARKRMRPPATGHGNGDSIQQDGRHGSKQVLAQGNRLPAVMCFMVLPFPVSHRSPGNTAA